MHGVDAWLTAPPSGGASTGPPCVRLRFPLVNGSGNVRRDARTARVDVRRGRPVYNALIVVPHRATVRVGEVPIGAASWRRTSDVLARCSVLARGAETERTSA